MILKKTNLWSRYAQYSNVENVWWTHESIYKPLNLIFKSYSETGQFPSDWKKANVAPVFKKGDKQLLKTYRPISLLPITGKMFERLLYNQMFEFFLKNDLISQNQSGFTPGDSYHSRDPQVF